MSSGLLDLGLLNASRRNLHDQSFDLFIDYHPDMANTHTPETPSATTQNVLETNGFPEQARINSTLPLYGPSGDLRASHSDVNWPYRRIAPGHPSTSVHEAENTRVMPFHHPLPLTENLTSNGALQDPTGSGMIFDHSYRRNTRTPLVVPTVRDE